ncbi:type 1 glutamine amidotransferase domain-containing protein [Chiayiivirga flava]|uniref:Protease I n=1 Tax=Chiayiivirga flava TaxID=659595 RepID=A0A7W8G2I2_9GAMM|nr:type 1 glutamine amidotransferase domain-containing protein [Chiayiivirga flava]MBB5208745.1 protease I [Chiayiivirga flava]
MASKQLHGKTVAILAADGFEESELTHPLKALTDAGAQVHVISLKAGSIQGFRHFEKGEQVKVDRVLSEVRADAYDALLVPGGLFNPDALRTERSALDFVKAIATAGKPVAAICHGPWVLADAGLLEGREVTSVASIRKDLENAGALWADKAVVTDNGIVTSRTPKDLEQFSAKVIEEIAEGRHARRAA